jgi:hypothetical protein
MQCNVGFQASQLPWTPNFHLKLLFVVDASKDPVQSNVYDELHNTLGFGRHCYMSVCVIINKKHNTDKVDLAKWTNFLRLESLPACHWYQWCRCYILPLCAKTNPEELQMALEWLITPPKEESIGEKVASRMQWVRAK